MPPKNIDKGIKPCEPILVTLDNLPNLSLSTIVIMAVEDGTLINIMLTPTRNRITNKTINNVLISMMPFLNRP